MRYAQTNGVIPNGVGVKIGTVGAGDAALATGDAAADSANPAVNFKNPNHVSGFIAIAYTVELT